VDTFASARIDSTAMGIESSRLGALQHLTHLFEYLRLFVGYINCL